ncbi:hypothetical protein N7457_002833 [Penicillium paradoxum]|uniref:uncharacterized protein n=1 Tax=Penicillium paradoxum TaxID=176176 RepID=UPI002548C4D7|nr:uncharacterized protein N7457_002833 [Penicillium paradoxum]KAJ5787843.1 hypothetical protein N7457_002833 [Penicillium paradoxum]
MPNMTSSKTFTPTSEPLALRPGGGSAPRPQARSAGTAERPGRNESLVDMVRFFQTPSATPAPQPPPNPEPQSHSRAHSQPQPSSPPDTTTALPVALSPKELKPEPKQDLKPFHRRLLQFAQRQKKESTPRSKEEDQRRQIEALTRAGYLIPAPPLKESKGQNEAKRSKESPTLSLSRSLSKSKRDVEHIGQPWLQAKADERKRSPEARRRLDSLDLDNFRSMVDVAVSLASDFDDSVPPPYQPTDNSSQPSPAVSPSNSLPDPFPQDIVTPASSLASTSHSQREESVDEPIQRSSISGGSNLRGSPQNTDSVSKVTSTAPASSNGTQSLPCPSIDSQKRDQPDQSSLRSVTPSQPALKLFPDVAPPRNSSKAARRTSLVPRYQVIENVASSPASSSRSGPPERSPEPPNGSRKSTDVFTDTPISEAEPKCSGALATSEASSAVQTPAQTIPKESVSQDQADPRRPSPSLGALKSFPLPAPTRPLPSLPEAERSPSAPPGTNARSVRYFRLGSGSSNLRSSSSALLEEREIESVADGPCTPELRPETGLGSMDAGGSMADDEESLFTPSLSEYSKQPSRQCLPRARVSSVRIPKMQDLPESPSAQGGEKDQPLADSPVLGHAALAQPFGKRATPKGLQINSKASRKNLQFGLPTPPLTASLPSAPPQQPLPAPPAPKLGQRSFTTSNMAMLSSMRSMDALAGYGSYRNSTISRSDSSGSSLRNESFPETYQQFHHQSRPETPLPSSDDEVFGPGPKLRVTNRKTDKQYSQPTRRRDEKMNQRQISNPRLRYPQQTRPMTPQSRSMHSLEIPSSPQSQYSQSTHRSRESQNSQHARAPQMDHYLEDRVANLERQNQLLQAALMAALNAGVKNPLEGLSHLGQTASPAFPHAPYAHQYSSHHGSRPDSWVSSSRSSEYSGFETSSSYRDGRANVKQLDNMIQDIESEWLSEKSSISRVRLPRKR